MIDMIDAQRRGKDAFEQIILHTHHFDVGFYFLHGEGNSTISTGRSASSPTAT
jgi:hypothetical protein